MSAQPDATTLLAGYADLSLSPVAVMQSCLERIDRMNPIVNAFVALAADALAQAQASEERWRERAPRGPLDGIPVAVKDNLIAAGMPATFGSRVFGDGQAVHDELPVARLRAAGAIVVGKTNTPEFAIEGYTANARFGVTRNPWEPALTPGGSSGGSVAAVASGMVPVAIGTDGGGSIRRPAAYTGLLGLKPSIGRVPRAGGLPQLLLDFEVVGPLARSVADLRLLMDVLSGPDRADPTSVRMRATEAPPAGRLRVLYAPLIGDAPCDRGILAACHTAARRLVELGHVVRQGALPFNIAEINGVWPRIGQVGVARMLLDLPEAAAALVPDKYRAIAALGERVAAPDFLEVLQIVERLRRAVSREFGDWDVILTPCCAAMPWAAEATHPLEIDGVPVGPRGHAIYTGWVNAAGLPGLSLPVASDGLPIGAQLVSDFGQDDLLLAIADQFMSGTVCRQPEPC